MSSLHLDAVRGAAALAVVAYHIRYKFFVDYSEAFTGSFATQLFYVITSFGHDAVMVFFVLSGYLITGTVTKDVAVKQWSWRKYLVNRLTRLYVVLIPGLLLTVVWDRLGMSLFPASVAYTGAIQPWKHDFFGVSQTLTPGVLLANLAFRQSIAGTPPLGSNGPLWSLTNEFAYYLIFPAVLLALHPTIAAKRRVVAALAAALLAWYFGVRILLYFPIWLMGLGIRFLPSLPVSAHSRTSWRNVVVLSTAIVLTAFRHTSVFAQLAGGASLEAGDFLVGLAFAFALYVLLQDRRPSSEGIYARTADASSRISYTLYVVHMPFLVFLRAWLNAGPQWAFSAGTAVRAAVLFAMCLVYAWLVYRCFEARTDMIRALIRERIAGGRHAEVPVTTAV